jgi:hypothetical protein
METKIALSAEGGIYKIRTAIYNRVIKKTE